MKPFCFHREPNENEYHTEESRPGSLMECLTDPFRIVANSDSIVTIANKQAACQNRSSMNAVLPAFRKARHYSKDSENDRREQGGEARLLFQPPTTREGDVSLLPVRIALIPPLHYQIRRGLMVAKKKRKRSCCADPIIKKDGTQEAQYDRTEGDLLIRRLSPLVTFLFCTKTICIGSEVANREQLSSGKSLSCPPISSSISQRRRRAPYGPFSYNVRRDEVVRPWKAVVIDHLNSSPQYGLLPSFPYTGKYMTRSPVSQCSQIHIVSGEWSFPFSDKRARVVLRIHLLSGLFPKNFVYKSLFPYSIPDLPEKSSITHDIGSLHPPGRNKPITLPFHYGFGSFPYLFEYREETQPLL
ncbi:hypothetical protein ACFE04_019625 [Oxalis oulophora]